jgi:hypothetical protein
VIPVGDFIGGIAGIFDASDAAADATEATEAAEAEKAATSADDPACPTAGGKSFTAGTLVLLASAKAVPISSLKPGDKVLASNVRTGKDQAEMVTAVLVNHDADLYDLTIKTSQGSSVIHTTASHQFWEPHLRQWVPANKLRKGEQLLTSDGMTAFADGGVTPRVHTGWMWDITVPGNNDHDFFVLLGQPGAQTIYNTVAGKPAVLVHNETGASDPWANAELWPRGNFPLGGATGPSGPPGGILYRVNGSGQIINYAVYDEQGMIIQRVDLVGAAHGGVPTPHIQDYSYNKTPDGRTFPAQNPDAKPAAPEDMPPAGFCP